MIVSYSVNHAAVVFLSVDGDLADDEKVNEKFTEEDFDEELGSPTEVSTRVPTSWKTRGYQEFCFEWNVREVSGNFAVCQGIILLLMKH